MECHDCGEETPDLLRVKVKRKVLRLCEDCADRRREQDEVASEAESVMREIMEYKGR